MLQIDKLRTRILIVSRSAPDPRGGSTVHMEDLIGWLKKSACEVHYAALCAPVGIDLSRSSVDTAYFPDAGEFRPVSFDTVAQDWEIGAVHKICQRAQPAMVIADYSWMGGIFDGAYFRENPSVRKVIFIHDLRVRILPSLVTMGLVQSADNPWTDAREGGLLAKADTLLTLNEEDKRTAAALAPQARVLRMGMSVSPQSMDPSAVVPGRCIYVASHARENLFAVMWLLKHVWPQVSQANPSASLIICGGVCDLLKTVVASGNAYLGNLDEMNVGIEGRVGDLKPYYASAEIALVPHWMRGGIKIKHLEAIAYGLAVVATPAGVDGLPEAVDYSTRVAEMPAEFADHLIRLMGDAGALETMRKNSRNLALKLTPAAVYREVADYLKEA